MVATSVQYNYMVCTALGVTPACPPDTLMDTMTDDIQNAIWACCLSALPESRLYVLADDRAGGAPADAVAESPDCMPSAALNVAPGCLLDTGVHSKAGGAQDSILADTLAGSVDAPPEGQLDVSAGSKSGGASDHKLLGALDGGPDGPVDAASGKSEYFYRTPLLPHVWILGV